jgi:hypothetical protein
VRRIALLAAAACVAATALAAHADEEGGPFVATPLDVDILYPADNASFRDANITAVVEADGESVAFFTDAFTSGTLVNATKDTSGVAGNGSGPGVESYYRSPEFELPRSAPTIEWLWSLEYTTSGGQGNLSDFFEIWVRFGDLTSGRNWSEWYPASIDGDFSAALGANGSFERTRGALQYQFTFLQPDATASPRLSAMQVWFIGHIEVLEVRRLPDPTWTLVATEGGRYNVTVDLPEGNSTIEVRVTDALGASRTASVPVSRDNSPPVVASAPAQGASIPPDEAVEIRFDGPMDTGSAVAAVTVQADFPVDRVWTADRTTLILSAQQAGRRGLVTVNIGPGLRDAAGNPFGQSVSYTYEMGTPSAGSADSTPLLIALAGIVGLAAVGVLYMMGRAKRDRALQSERFVGDASQEARRPPGGR